MNFLKKGESSIFISFFFFKLSLYRVKHFLRLKFHWGGPVYRVIIIRKIVRSRVNFRNRAARAERKPKSTIRNTLCVI